MVEFICPQCGFNAETRAGLRTHLANHTMRQVFEDQKRFLHISLEYRNTDIKIFEYGQNQIVDVYVHKVKILC